MIIIYRTLCVCVLHSYTSVKESIVSVPHGNCIQWRRASLLFQPCVRVSMFQQCSRRSPEGMVIGQWVREFPSPLSSPKGVICFSSLLIAINLPPPPTSCQPACPMHRYQKIGLPIHSHCLSLTCGCSHICACHPLWAVEAKHGGEVTSANRWENRRHLWQEKIYFSFKESALQILMSVQTRTLTEGIPL